MKNVEQIVRDLILSIEGEMRPHLEETPARVRRMMGEIFDGYGVDISSLFKSFDGEGKDQVVIARNIETHSICEHHLMPFLISANVAYLPDDRVIGASKMARLVHAYAHRLQLQERITEQVGNSLMEYLKPRGVAVVIKGEHMCMRLRGVKSTNSEIVTSVMLGEFRENSNLRQEVLLLLRGNGP